MKLKRRVLIIVALLLIVGLIVGLLPGNAIGLNGYYRYVYTPAQSVRGYLFNYLPISIGDAIYIVAGGWVLYTLVKSGRYLVKCRSEKNNLVRSALGAVTVLLSVYIAFVVGWGANYYQQPLYKTWALDKGKDTLDLVAFDSILVDRLNRLAPAYKDLSLEAINAKAKEAYAQHTDISIAQPGLRIKYSYFGYFLDRLAIEGYYNPFTGEGQISYRLPAFMLPFVISHEMAHQAGIAAEGDANLLAYAVGTSSADPSFLYSANLNLWLYVNARLGRRDSVAAQLWENKLNSLTQQHLQILEERSKLYDNDASRYSGEMFDSYLKMQQQKQGIKSYGNVTANAWQLERLRQKGEAPVKFQVP
jgi:hypothetical protein